MDPIQVHISEKLHARFHLRRFRNPNPGLRTSTTVAHQRAQPCCHSIQELSSLIPRGVTARVQNDMTFNETSFPSSLALPVQARDFQRDPIDPTRPLCGAIALMLPWKSATSCDANVPPYTEAIFFRPPSAVARCFVLIIPLSRNYSLLVHEGLQNVKRRGSRRR
jgi:hypothetical protein